ncbi:MAG TPA: hypothetical protein VEH27_11825 [Methylomirabilota bacterium]|nr:hypothetical protein [Methylomirabilota bacterium]
MATNSQNIWGWSGGGIDLLGKPKANANPFETLTNVKNPEIEKRQNALLAEFDGLLGTNRDALSAFEAALKQTQPKAQAILNEDLGIADGLAGGKLRSELDLLRSNRRTAIRQAADRALGKAGRAVNQTQMAMSAGSANPVGTSSYLQKLTADKRAEIETQAALDDAVQGRVDSDYLTQLQLGLLGRRGGLLDAFAQRELAPVAANNQNLMALASLLGQLLNTNLGNNFYGLSKPIGA